MKSLDTDQGIRKLDLQTDRQTGRQARRQTEPYAYTREVNIELLKLRGTIFHQVCGLKGNEYRNNFFLFLAEKWNHRSTIYLSFAFVIP